jgi:Flp pilus assembly pilin Flp
MILTGAAFISPVTSDVVGAAMRAGVEARNCVENEMNRSILRRVMTEIAVDQRGIAALEYTLILVIVGTFIIGCVQTLGTSLTNSYAAIGSALQNLALAANGGG